MPDNPLKGRSVLLGVTGSVAAFRAADIASKLAQDGISVRVILTSAACRFISPLTFESLTGNPAGYDMWAGGGSGSFPHLEAARNADLALVAPATADFIAKMAGGIADDLLSSAILAVKGPVLLAPAMNTAMLENEATQENLARLRGRGVEIIETDEGHLACGDTGKGRLASVECVTGAVRHWLERLGSWKGKNVLVTAGPTREPMDAVRHISNPSSGRMGYALARAAARRGANVLLVSGPADLPVPPGVQLVRVVTAAQMRRAVIDRFPGSDLLVMAAAVSDYKAVDTVPTKTKDKEWTVRLEKIPNIIEAVMPDRKGQVVVGFAAEAGEPDAEGARKLHERGLDLVVANDISREESGFISENNQATLIFPDGKKQKTEIIRKGELAEMILNAIEPKLLNKGS
jgi:phosphopantothenoylcysteine decarboxylase/phosphopantothenate--cysteine ligase